MAFVLYKGTPWTRRLTLTLEGTTTRADLTGKTVSVQLRRRPGEPLLVSAGVELLAQSGDTLGQADVTIPAEDSEGLAVGSCVLTVLVDGVVVMGSVRLPVRPI